MLCPCARHFMSWSNPGRNPDMTEKLLTEVFSIKIKKTNLLNLYPRRRVILERHVNHKI